MDRELPAGQRTGIFRRLLLVRADVEHSGPAVWADEVIVPNRELVASGDVLVQPIVRLPRSSP